MRLRTYWVHSPAHGPLLLSALDEQQLSSDSPPPEWHLQRVQMATANGLEVKAVDIEFSTRRLGEIVGDGPPIIYGEPLDADTQDMVG